MATLNLILADDLGSVHADLKETIASLDFECKVLEDFYDTMSLTDYLYDIAEDETAEQPDVLILDDDFGGNSQRGSETIPEIRGICPNLPILLLTTYENKLFDEVCTQYQHVDYARKPIKVDDLRQRILSSVRQIQDWEKFQQSFQKELQENQELLDYMEQENLDLNNTLAIERDQSVAQVLPLKMQELIQYVFPDIEFTPRSFRLLVRNPAVKEADWMRMFRCLKLIDWKNDDVAPAGVKIQKYVEGKSMGYKDMWEYRFSQAGRIFVERRGKTEKPLILLIDPSHEYSKMAKI